MNTSGIDGIFGRFSNFFDADATDEVKILHDKFFVWFFGTILVLPVCDCDCDDSKFKRRWRPIKH